MYIHIHMHVVTINKIKEAMNLKEIREGTWEGLEIEREERNTTISRGRG